MAPKRKSIDGFTEPNSKRAKLIANQIHQACLIGESETVQNLLNQIPHKHKIKPEIDANRTLHVVSKSGNVTIVKELLKIGVDLDCQTEHGEAPLHIACENGHVEIVEELLKNGANANNKCFLDKVTPLHCVDTVQNQENATKIVQLLLKHGAKVNAKDVYGGTPLYAASRCGNIAVVKELLKNGANVSARFETPLHAAAKLGQVEVIEELLIYNADINAKDRKKYTPLHYASLGGQGAAVAKLLELGADMNELNEDNNPALSMACEEGHLEVVKLFLKHGARLEHSRDEQLSPLLLATINEHLNVVKELLRQGAYVDITCDEYGTALHYAAMYNYPTIVEELLKNGANINAQNLDGETALHKAIKGENDRFSPFSEEERLAMIKILLDEKYKIDLNCDKGPTPLEMAIEEKRLDIARLISKRMCLKPKITDSIYPLKLFM